MWLEWAYRIDPFLGCWWLVLLMMLLHR
jgi:hypothetical protein